MRQLLYWIAITGLVLAVIYCIADIVRLYRRKRANPGVIIQPDYKRYERLKIGLLVCGVILIYLKHF